MKESRKQALRGQIKENDFVDLLKYLGATDEEMLAHEKQIISNKPKIEKTKTIIEHKIQSHLTLDILF